MPLVRKRRKLRLSENMQFGQSHRYLGREGRTLQKPLPLSGPSQGTHYGYWVWVWFCLTCLFKARKQWRYGKMFIVENARAIDNLGMRTRVQKYMFIEYKSNLFDGFYVTCWSQVTIIYNKIFVRYWVRTSEWQVTISTIHQVTLYPHL